MSRLRILGPRQRLDEVLGVLQDAGTLHLAPPDAAAVGAFQPGERQLREERQLSRIADDLDRAISLLAIPRSPARTPARADIATLARWARMARRVRREAERIDADDTAAREERALIQKYQHFFSAFRALLETERRWPNSTAYHVLLKDGSGDALTRLRTSLATVAGQDFELFSQPLPSKETAVLIVVERSQAAAIEKLLAEVQVREIPVPERYGGGTLAQAIPQMLARMDELPRERAALAQRRERLARQHATELLLARSLVHDRLAALRAVTLSGATPRAFVIDGWVPADGRRVLLERLERAFGNEVAVSELAREQWTSPDAPVVLRNPRILRPFEALIGLMPLPRYGTIDPTPFVAVFFPAFFGIMLGDIGYGLVLAALAAVMHRRTRKGSVARDIAEIGGVCAGFGIAGGVLFGEMFGDLGRHLFGLRPVAFDREQALLPFLMLAVALGAVHVLIGLVLGAISNLRRHPRAALGRGISALMLLMIGAALLAATGVLPKRFFSPMVIALLAAFPVLVVAEGLVAPIELLSTVGNILSYARIMALGVASVMMAVVANDMVGAAGSVAVGVVFALLFHLVNFAIAVFSPTIHALRLHYVEFFGKFYSPGGERYQPFGHWTGAAASPRPAHS